MTILQSGSEVVRTFQNDGWIMEVASTNEDYTTLKKEGWTVMLFFKKNEINVWGPDGLGVDITMPYNWEEWQKALYVCDTCHTTNVATTRMGYANRVCSKCRNDPKVASVYEFPGWTD
jgi:hypothetical protein